jgi:RimJ/RimL family protein N-acetyltransferase
MLTGTLIKLRPSKAADVPLLSALRNDLELQLALMAVPRPNSRARVKAWIARRSNDPEGAFFVVARPLDDKAIGFIQLVRIDTLHRRAEMGICLATDARGSGASDEAMAMIENYASGALGLQKLVLQVGALNRRAISLYERAGFLRVGMLKAHHFASGRFHDVLIMEKFLRRKSR